MRYVDRLSSSRAHFWRPKSTAARRSGPRAPFTSIPFLQSRSHRRWSSPASGYCSSSYQLFTFTHSVCYIHHTHTHAHTHYTLNKDAKRMDFINEARDVIYGFVVLQDSPTRSFSHPICPSPSHERGENERPREKTQRGTSCCPLHPRHGEREENEKGSTYTSIDLLEAPSLC